MNNFSNQKAKLNSIVLFALKNNEYYRTNSKLYLKHQNSNSNNGMMNYPIIDSETLKNHYSEFISDSYKKFPLSQQVLINRVIEKTGRMLKIIWDIEDYKLANKNTWSIRTNQYGVKINDRFCAFYSNFYRANKLVEEKQPLYVENNSGVLFNIYNLTNSKIMWILNTLNNYEPKWISIPSGVAIIIANFFKSTFTAFPKSVSYIEIYGDYISKEMRNELRSIFKCQVAFQYKVPSIGTVALECKCGNLHIFNDNVYIEKNILKDEMLITGLINHAMPIIHYNTHECAKISNIICNCGIKSPIITIDSEEFPVFTLKHNQLIAKCAIEGAIEHTNELMENAIDTFSINQKNESSFKINMHLKPAFISWGEAIQETFCEVIKDDILSMFNWNFSFITE